MTRKLATVRTIHRLDPIEGADLIELAKIDGWQVVVKKGEFKVDDKVIYFEIDSWIPSELAPFLSKGKLPKLFNNVWGERLRTIRLKGQLSQGLVLPAKPDAALGEDLTQALNIQLYEKPLPAQLAGKAKGNFPSFIPKTDQERIQNIPNNVLESWQNDRWEVTEKLDGSSMTIYLNKDVFGVCSRNIDLKLDQEGNTFVDIGKRYEATLRKWNHNIAIQGELVGPGIQGNQYELTEHKFYVFDIFDIDNQQYFNAHARCLTTKLLNMLHVPLIVVTVLNHNNKNQILKEAEGQSKLNNSTREGLVFKRIDGKESFKAISNEWLIKNERN